jgi:hypothetical protein
MVLAVPAAVGIALFITQYAPCCWRSRSATWSTYWRRSHRSSSASGASTCWPRTSGVQHLLYHVGAIPLFKDKGFDTGTVFNAAVVLAIMILPIVSRVARRVRAHPDRAYGSRLGSGSHALGDDPPRCPAARAGRWWSAAPCSDLAGRWARRSR